EGLGGSFDGLVHIVKDAKAALVAAAGAHRGAGHLRQDLLHHAANELLRVLHCYPAYLNRLFVVLSWPMWPPYSRYLASVSTRLQPKSLASIPDRGCERA